jgi:hypothetical protein
MKNLRWKVGVIIVIILAAFASIEFYRFEKLLPSGLEHKPSQHPEEVKHSESQKQYPMLAGGRPRCSQDMSVSLENIENFAWSYCNFDLRRFWGNLGIPMGPFKDSSFLFQVSSTYGDLDGDHVDERFLHLRISGGRLSRIVVLKRSPQDLREWRGLAFIDLDTFHLDPEADVVTNGRERWMAVSHIEKAWGTEIFQENEAWYVLTNRGFREVLSFPTEGHLHSVGIPTVGVSFKTTTDLTRFDGLRDSVNVEYATTLSEFERVGPIRKMVSFTKEPSSLKFVFDPAASTVSRSEFLAIFNFDSGKFTPQYFLNFAYEKLRVIAQGDNASREWLSALLDSCDATTQNVCPELTRLVAR